MAKLRHEKQEGYITFQPTYFTPFVKTYVQDGTDYSNRIKWKLKEKTRRHNISREEKKHNGLLSQVAKTKLRNALFLLKLISKPKTVFSKLKKQHFKFKMNFITLDVPYPQLHSDSYYTKHLLDNFLQWAKRYKNMNSYVWKAEIQKNGSLHFHITSNVFIHWKSIANKWDELLSKHGHYNNGTKIPTPEDSASTSVKSVINENELVGYLVKYICKKAAESNYCERYCSIEENEISRQNHNYSNNENKINAHLRREVTCRIWSASYNLINKKIIIKTENNEDYLPYEESIFRHVESKTTTPHFTVYYHKQEAWRYRGFKIYNQYKAMIQKVMQGESKIKKYDLDAIEAKILSR